MKTEVNQLLLNDLAMKAKANNLIEPEIYDMYNVKRGLRNSNGTGVLVGLTEIGNVVGYNMHGNEKCPTDGRLYYRGIEVSDLVSGFQSDGRRGLKKQPIYYYSEHYQLQMS